ncbi:MAG: alkane 1-monooxygenase [Candidatus Obscuribacterales bacterium]|nr:alkane 1-monooxygenase [Steroidobacteraceae bacterium]
MAFVAQTAAGKTIRYVDGKRYLWSLSLTGAFIPVLAIAMYFASGGNPFTMLFPLLYTFVGIPIIDALMGGDRHNPPEEVVALMARDNYYRVLLYIAIALLFAGFFFVAWFVGTHTLPVWAFVAITLGTAFDSSAAILLGHELGHKSNRTDRTAAQIAQALVGYGHFCIEHNRGHHVQVATPEDCVSARMGESIYKFVKREMPGALRRGWRLETDRLAKLGHGAVHWQNEILLSWLLTVTIAIGLIVAFGWIMVPFVILHHLYAWYGLTQANYVEHYGLLRQKLPNGRYELCEPRHSWNTNHIFSNLISFHLQRHSDHHANALRPYQTLRDFDDVPRLPSGYPGSFGLAAIPPLWFKVMNPKLMEWAGGDITKINIDPDKKEQLYAKYVTAREDLAIR